VVKIACRSNRNYAITVDDFAQTVTPMAWAASATRRHATPRAIKTKPNTTPNKHKTIKTKTKRGYNISPQYDQDA